jgi:N-methylhydantoinase A/oxoprolinase/acetone carboxylase beta subunit
MPKLPALPAPESTGLEEARIDEAPVRFTEDGSVVSQPTAFYHRDKLPVGETIQGPAVLVQFDSTVVVPPGASAEALPTGDVLVRV